MFASSRQVMERCSKSPTARTESARPTTLLSRRLGPRLQEMTRA